MTSAQAVQCHVQEAARWMARRTRATTTRKSTARSAQRGQHARRRPGEQRRHAEWDSRSGE
eukprot:15920637-Heterocapsa_arctica.AAC.1